MSEQQPEALRLANEAMCRLPGNDGAEIAAELRRLHTAESVAVELAAQYAAERDQLRAELSRLQAGGQDESVRSALRNLLATGGAIADASDDELRAAIDDPKAEPIVKQQADAVLKARAALAHPPAAPALVPLTRIDELAKVYAKSYASPHHFTIDCEGVRNIINGLTVGDGGV